MRLADTDILIDVQRGYAPAVTWFSTLPEGVNVELIVMLDALPQMTAPREALSMLELIGSLPKSPTPRAFSAWAEYERFLQDEKEATVFTQQPRR
jgi:hypothetical protein